jgi:hypothetical protein
MENQAEHNLGTQPLQSIMDEKGLTPHDLVVASPKQITHKMVTRGRKGRRLTRKVQFKVLNALNAAIESEHEYTLKEVFNY